MSEVRLTAAQLRTLAHPLRSRLLSALRVESPQTATRLAERLGTNTGATSYHLRQLAAAGLVAEDERPGRERWWRSAHQSHSWVESDIAADDADGQAAVDWLLGYYLRSFIERAQSWIAQRRHWSQRWRDVTGHSDYLLELTPDQLAALHAEVAEVVGRYRRLPRAEGAEPVLYYVHSFPRLEEGR